VTLYRTIVADPPWPYADAGRNGEGGRALVGSIKRDGNPSINVATAYEPMSIADLCALQPSAAPDAHLYLWTTNAFMVEAHEVARAWGFAPKTILTWVKVQANGEVSRKTGYYFRGATEHALFCVRGSQRLCTREALPTAYLWPRAPHSVKPDAFYDLVELASPGPYLELFARRARMGDWHYWGDESLGTAVVA
jgi:N6-adenosine-specific RNA methylase IME4